MSAKTFDPDRRDAERSPADRLVGSPAPPLNAPHEGLTGDQVPPMGNDPRPGNVGRAAEAPKPDDLEDQVGESSAESFPASDPPSWSAGATTGEDGPDPAGSPGHHGLGRVVEEAPGDETRGAD